MYKKKSEIYKDAIIAVMLCEQFTMDRKFDAIELLVQDKQVAQYAEENCTEGDNSVQMPRV